MRSLREVRGITMICERDTHQEIRSMEAPFRKTILASNAGARGLLPSNPSFDVTCFGNIDSSLSASNL